jgi:hypothetical protein
MKRRKEEEDKKKREETERSNRYVVERKKSEAADNDFKVHDICDSCKGIRVVCGSGYILICISCGKEWIWDELRKCFKEDRSWNVGSKNEIQRSREKISEYGGKIQSNPCPHCKSVVISFCGNKKFICSGCRNFEIDRGNNKGEKESARRSFGCGMYGQCSFCEGVLIYFEKEKRILCINCSAEWITTSEDEEPLLIEKFEDIIHRSDEDNKKKVEKAIIMRGGEVYKEKCSKCGNICISF